MEIKIHKIIYILVIMILFIVISFRVFYPNGDVHIYDKEFRDVDINTAREISLKSPADYKVGENEFEEGFYDITCTEGKVDINGVLCLTENQTAKNIGIANFDHQELTYDGVICLKPSTFSKINISDNKYILENTCGEFKVGYELASGTYDVEFYLPNESYEFFVQTVNENSDAEKTYDIKKGYDKPQFEIVLKEGHMLIIECRKPIDDYKIVLKKKINQSVYS